MQRLLEGLPDAGAASNVEAMLRARLAADGAAAPDHLSPVLLRLAFARRLAARASETCAELSRQYATQTEVTLGVRELQALKTCAQVVAAWWLAPLLEPGVGVPVARRVGTREAVQLEGPPLGQQVKNPQRLLLAALGWMCSLLHVPFAQSVVREQHLTDVFAGYLQLGYAPGAWHGTDAADRTRIRDALARLLQYLDAATVFEHLLTLVSPASPAWLQPVVGSMLSRTLARPRGVVTLLSVMLDKADARNTPGALDHVTVLVTSVPRGREPTSYYAELCDVQLEPCFRATSDAVRRCVSMCVERLMRQDCATVCTHLLDRLVAPLVGPGPSDEASVDAAVADLALLLIPCGGGGGSGVADAFWTWFARVAARPLFELGCFVRTKAVARLRQPVMQLLESALRLPEPRLVRAVLHSALLDRALPGTVVAAWALSATGGCMRPGGSSVVVRDWELECRVAVDALARAPAGVVGDVFAEALSVACDASGRVDEPHQRAMMLLCAELLEQPEKLAEDAVQVFVVLKTLLGSCNGDDELLASLLAVLQGVLASAGQKFQRHQEVLLTDLVPVLETIQTDDAKLRALCVQLRADLQDPNAAWRAKQPPPPQQQQQADEEGSHFAGVLRDLADPLLPVRAHALVVLRKLVLAKDATTMANLAGVMATIKRQLHHEDSFVFLGAVQALSALGDVCPTQTIPVLVADFHDTSLPDDVRLKLAEAAVLIAQRCGDVLPVYAPQLMHCFLRGVRDSSPAVRASSLSNIGFMCEMLHWALHAYVVELVAAVRAVLQSERDALVRRAAVVVLALLVRGCGDDVVELVRGQLRDVVSVLHTLERSDGDDLVRIHARDALAELRQVVGGTPHSPLIVPL